MRNVYKIISVMGLFVCLCFSCNKYSMISVNAETEANGEGVKDDNNQSQTGIICDGINYNYDKYSSGLEVTFSGNGKLYRNYSDSTLEENKEVKKVVIQNGITSVDVNIFSLYPNVEEIKLSNTVKTIDGYSSELRDSKVKYLYITKSVESIDLTSFLNVYFDVDSENNTYSSIDGNLLSKDGKTLIAYTQFIDNCVYVPENVEILGNNFLGSRDFSNISVYLPKSVKEINGLYINADSFDIFYEGSRQEWVNINNYNIAVKYSYHPGNMRGNTPAYVHYNNDTSIVSSEWNNGNWFGGDGKPDTHRNLEWNNDGIGWWVKLVERSYTVNNISSGISGKWEKVVTRTDYHENGPVGPDGSHRVDEYGYAYLFDSWVKIDGEWYYFDNSGYMVSNEWKDGCWLGDDGTWSYKSIGSWNKDSRGWWFGDESGWYASDCWQKIDGDWYYFNSSGYMVTNRYIDGYYLDYTGKCR